MIIPKYFNDFQGSNIIACIPNGTVISIPFNDGLYYVWGMRAYAGFDKDDRPTYGNNWESAGIRIIFQPGECGDESETIAVIRAHNKLICKQVERHYY